MQTGQRVHLKFSPDTRGTITALGPNGRFRVSWDSIDRPRGRARNRVWFEQDAMLRMGLGKPA